MEILTLRCKVITPVFMMGSDSSSPELRASEFKGMMRFWWRAIRGDDNINKLRKDEAEIFGGTGEKEGKSRVIIKVYPQPGRYIGDNLKNDLEDKDAGIRYLLYSTVLPNRERSYIKPGFEFYISLSSFDENSFKNALASLWASIYLGGFGTRARRGAGNIVVENIEGDTFGLDFVPKGENNETLFNWLKSNLDKCFLMINNGMVKNFCAKYTNLSFSRIIISNQEFEDWKGALNDIGREYAKFRENHRAKIFDTAVFGLPIVYRDKTTKVEGKYSERRGSPLIIKILVSNSRFYWLTLRLTGEFLQENDALALKKKTRDKWKIKKTQKPNYELIDEFWNTLKKGGKEFIFSKPEILDKIIEKIKSDCDPERIVLFGSRARGDAHKNADIDIAVEKPRKPISVLDIIAPIDIVGLDNANSDLRDRIEKEGVIVYERKG